MKKLVFSGHRGYAWYTDWLLWIVPSTHGSEVMNVFSTPIFSKVTSRGHQYNLEDFPQPGSVSPLVYMRVQSASLSMLKCTNDVVCGTDTMRGWHRQTWEKRLFSHSSLAAGVRAQCIFCSDSAFDYLKKPPVFPTLFPLCPFSSLKKLQWWKPYCKD